MASYTWSAISAAFKNLRGTLGSFKRSKGLELQIYQRTRTCLRYDGRFHSQAMRVLWRLTAAAGGGSLAMATVVMDEHGDLSLTEDPVQVLLSEARDVRKGNVEEAVAKLKDAIGMILDDSNLTDQYFLTNYANGIDEVSHKLFHLGRYDEAAYGYSSMIQFRQKLGIPTSQIMNLDAILSLTEIAVKRNNFETAERLQKSSIVSLRQSLKDLQVKSLLAGRQSEAEVKTLTDIKHTKRVLAKALTFYGSSMIRKGRNDQANSLFKEAHCLLHDQDGLCNPRTMAVMGKMILMKVQQQQYEAAEKLMRWYIIPCREIAQIKIELTED